MHTKFIQNTEFVYILYTKIPKFQDYQNFVNNEYTKNVNQIPTYIQKRCKTCTHTVQTKNSLKLEIYVFCIYTQHTN